MNSFDLEQNLYWAHSIEYGDAEEYVKKSWDSFTKLKSWSGDTKLSGAYFCALNDLNIAIKNLKMKFLNSGCKEKK